jgi:hypothetical protein
MVGSGYNQFLTDSRAFPNTTLPSLRYLLMHLHSKIKQITFLDGSQPSVEIPEREQH